MAQKKRRKWKTQENRRTWCEIPKVQREFKYTHWFQGRKFKNKKSNLFFLTSPPLRVSSGVNKSGNTKEFVCFLLSLFFAIIFPAAVFKIKKKEIIIWKRGKRRLDYYITSCGIVGIDCGCHHDSTSRRTRLERGFLSLSVNKCIAIRLFETSMNPTAHSYNSYISWRLFTTRRKQRNKKKLLVFSSLIIFFFFRSLSLSRGEGWRKLFLFLANWEVLGRSMIYVRTPRHSTRCGSGRSHLVTQPGGILQRASSLFNWGWMEWMDGRCIYWVGYTSTDRQGSIAVCASK